MTSRRSANLPKEAPRARRSVASAVAGHPISAGGATTLHEQIKTYVAQKILDGTWATGQRLPSEHELVAQFGVSRMTVNKVLRDFASTGRIVRVAGVGSFVAEDKPQSTLLQIANIASEIQQRGHDYGFQLITMERLAAAPDVAVWLDLRPGESVFHSLCLHLENGLPVQLEDRFVNPRVVPTYLEQDFSSMGPGEYLLHTVPFDQIEHVVDAVLPSAEQAAHLSMAASEPCLLLTRRTWTRDVPVTLVRCLHPASRYRLGSRFRPDGNPTSG